MGFIPSNLMASGQDYKVTFLVDAIYQNTNLPDFDFNFHTLQQAVFPEFVGIQHTDENDYQHIIYNGEIKTADYADLDDIQTIIKASQNGRNLEVKWQISELENHFLFS